ncbi:16S rRNA (guanine(527)-N(7))-methyltransferase RsmG [Celeribacter sp.]|uniref:16S rRNA (guanine(527)-N(7))-methyltransferase RsmG n=1 Tax=Celeribacter sp. TaxID=1890673 RepID=UPI003A8F9DF7
MQDLSVAGLSVSRETIERLEAYLALLRKWNPAINLVSKNTLDAAWERHFIDSAQLFALAPKGEGHWVDLGTGGGFPGMVCAIISAEVTPERTFTMIESDQRKATFLRTVAREVEVPVTVLSERVEQAHPANAQVLSARALASLADLIGFAHRHLASDGVAFFPKGARHANELAESQKSWRFKYQEHPSVTDAEAVIFEIGDIERA